MVKVLGPKIWQLYIPGCEPINDSTWTLHHLRSPPECIYPVFRRSPGGCWRFFVAWPRALSWCLRHGQGRKWGMWEATGGGLGDTTVPSPGCNLMRFSSWKLTAGTWKSPLWKGNSSFKSPFWGSILIFGSAIESFFYFLNFDRRTSHNTMRRRSTILASPW